MTNILSEQILLTPQEIIAALEEGLAHLEG